MHVWTAVYIFHYICWRAACPSSYSDTLYLSCDWRSSALFPAVADNQHHWEWPQALFATVHMRSQMFHELQNNIVLPQMVLLNKGFQLTLFKNNCRTVSLLPSKWWRTYVSSHVRELSYPVAASPLSLKTPTIFSACYVMHANSDLYLHRLTRSSTSSALLTVVSAATLPWK